MLWLLTVPLLLYLAFGLLLWWQQDRLLYPAPPDHGAIPAPLERNELLTRDGLRLAAAWQAPEGERPVVVHFHGNGGNLAGAAIETGMLAPAGYGRLLVTYRGYGSNLGRPSEEGFYEDGRAALAWLRGRGIEGSRTIISGNSIGSGTAVQMTLEHPPAALVLTSPFTALDAIAAEKLRLYPVRRMIRDRFDNLTKIGAVEAPVLVVHGTADRLIPPAHGRALSEAAPDGTFVAIEGAGHELSFMPEAQQTIVRWLNERLAPGAINDRLRDDDRSR